MERDAEPLEYRRTRGNFNSHAHVERDQKLASLSRKPSDFNSHAHVERDPSTDRAETNPANFNSHAHVERDVYVFEGRLDVHISTHTLTWSVTAPRDYAAGV